MIALNGSMFEWPGLRVSGHVAAEHALLTVQDELEPSGLLTHTAVLCALFGATSGRAQTAWLTGRTSNGIWVGREGGLAEGQSNNVW